MKRSMTFVALTLFFAFSSSVYALNENFEGGGSGYGTESGHFSLKSEMGNSYMSFTLEDGDSYASLKFSDVAFSSDNPTLSFDYKFSYSLDMDKFNAFADSLLATENTYVDLLSLEFGAADTFNVGTWDYTFYQQQIFPDFTQNPVVNTPVLNCPAMGFNVNANTPALNDISAWEGFVHVDLDLTEFVNYLSLQAGQTYVDDLYFEIWSIGMGVTYNNTPIPSDIFTYTASVDNIALGAPTAAVPEPTACALFVVGMFYLGRRIKRK